MPRPHSNRASGQSCSLVSSDSLRTRVLCCVTRVCAALPFISFRVVSRDRAGTTHAASAGAGGREHGHVLGIGRHVFADAATLSGRAGRGARARAPQRAAAGWHGWLGQSVDRVTLGSLNNNIRFWRMRVRTQLAELNPSSRGKMPQEALSLEPYWWIVVWNTTCILSGAVPCMRDGIQSQSHLVPPARSAPEGSGGARGGGSRHATHCSGLHQSRKGGTADCCMHEESGAATGCRYVVTRQRHVEEKRAAPPACTCTQASRWGGISASCPSVAPDVNNCSGALFVGGPPRPSAADCMALRGELAMVPCASQRHV